MLACVCVCVSVVGSSRAHKNVYPFSSECLNTRTVYQRMRISSEHSNQIQFYRNSSGGDVLVLKLELVFLQLSLFLCARLWVYLRRYAHLIFPFSTKFSVLCKFMVPDKSNHWLSNSGTQNQTRINCKKIYLAPLLFMCAVVSSPSPLPPSSFCLLGLHWHFRFIFTILWLRDCGRCLRVYVYLPRSRVFMLCGRHNYDVHIHMRYKLSARTEKIE